MSTNPKSRLRLGGLALAALSLAVTGALVSPPASASGFQISENTAKALGRAYAGREAAADDPSVVVNNPAAMAWLEGYQLEVVATAIDVNTRFHGSGTDAIGMPLSGGNGGNGGDVNGVPAIFFVMPIGDAWRIGFGLDAPFGLKTDYDAGWMGRYQALKSSVKSMDFTGSVSWKLNPQFSVGASIIAQKTTVDLSNAVDFGAILAAPPFGLAPTFLPQSADGTARIRGDNWKWGWQLGATWKPTPQDTIAVDYHSKINHHINGNAYFTVPQSVQFVFSQTGLPLFQDTGAHGAFATPAIASVSYWHQTQGPVSWGLELGWTGWSSFKSLAVTYDNPAQPPTNIPYNWRNTLFGSVGMDYKVNDQWTLRGGLAFDQTPTRDSTRDPRIPDGARRWIALGAGWTPMQNVEFDIGYAHLFVDDGNVNDVSATGDHLVGSFKNSGNLLGIQGTFKF